MSKKKTMIPCIVAMALFSLSLIKTINLNVILTDATVYGWIVVLYGIVSILMNLTILSGMILKSFSTFSVRFADKTADKLGSIFLLAGLLWLAIEDVFLVLLDRFRLNTLIYFLLNQAALALLVILILNVCILKKENSKFTSFVKKAWFVPTILLLSAQYFGGVDKTFGFFFSFNLTRLFEVVYCYSFFALSMWIVNSATTSEADIAQPQKPVINQPAYTPPVNHVQPQPVYTQPVAPARPVYTPPVQPTYTVAQAQNSTNSVDVNSQVSALQMYKALLDNGTITQEDYDKKKKEILGL